MVPSVLPRRQMPRFLGCIHPVLSSVLFFSKAFQSLRTQASCSLPSRLMAESIEDSSSSTDETLMDEDEVNKFSAILDQFTPAIPETVTQYYLKQSGVQTDDERVVKLISASVQKFMSGKASRASQRTSLVLISSQTSSTIASN